MIIQVQESKSRAKGGVGECGSNVVVRDSRRKAEETGGPGVEQAFADKKNKVNGKRKNEEDKKKSALLSYSPILLSYHTSTLYDIPDRTPAQYSPV
jgi:hypothetical protein